MSLPGVFAVVLLACAAACSGSPGATNGVPDRSAVPAVPAEEPSIRGTVTRVEAGIGGAPWSVLIEETPGTTSGDDKAMVTVPAETRIHRRTNDGIVPAALTDLKAGLRVSAWFSGPVAQSYPVQATAATIIIEG